MGITRRRALESGAWAFAAIAGLDSIAELAEAAPASARERTVSFDEDWRFVELDLPGAQAADFDDSGWRKLDLPHDFRIEDLPDPQSDDGGATADPSLYLYLTDPAAVATAPKRIGPFTHAQDPTVFGGRGQGWTVGGVGWYRKRFTVAGVADDARVEVRFDGAYRTAEVWINGVELGKNLYGYTPFVFDLTPYLKRGAENVIAVRVEDVGQTGRWYTGSGIYRHTWLTVSDPLHVPAFGVYVSTPAVGQRSLVRTAVEVRNDAKAPASVRVRTTLVDPQGHAAAREATSARTVKPGEEITFTLEQTVGNSQLWSLDHPNLYTARVEVLRDDEVVDAVDQTFGIRSIALDPKRGFLVNGEPVKFAGANVHHDHGPLGAVALNRSEERRVQILKARGFNAYRASHNPPTPALLDCCDRLGMLVMDESYDNWDLPKTPQAYPEFASDWERSFTAHIRRDRNHPSVVMWSLGNEITTDPNGRGAMLAAKLRELDKTRPILIGGQYDSAAWEYCDMGDEHYVTDLTRDHDAHPDKVISQSESYPSTVYDDWAFQDAHPWAVGNFVWTGWDHIGEAGLGVPGADPAAAPGTTGPRLGELGLVGTYGYPWVVNGSGDIDLIGQPRSTNLWRQVVYGRSPLELVVERPMPDGFQQYAYRWTWYDELESWTWDVPEGRVMRVRAYTSGDQAELLLNGKSVASNPLEPADRMITTFDVPYAPGVLTVISRKGGREIGRRTLNTVGKPAALRLVPDVKSLTTGRDDLAHVTAEVLDDKGRLVPDAVLKVDFKVAGAGTLAGVANGNPHNVDSFQRPRRWTFQGRALAILRPGKAPGTVSLTATADGLAGATIELPVRAAGAEVAPPVLDVRFDGRRGMVATVASLDRVRRGVTVELRRGGDPIARSSKKSIGRAARRFVLRPRPSRAGRYTLVVRQGSTLLHQRSVRLSDTR